MDKPETAEIETVLQIALEKQSRRIGELILQLDLAHSQIEYFKSREKQESSDEVVAE